jgi:DNA-binding CsgD family transcriptional regulator
MCRSGHRVRPGLSRRQRVILTLFATGLTSGEVADVLRLSVIEVRTDLGTAIGILGARSKLEAVVIALGNGLIELSPGPRLARAQRDQAGGEVDGSISEGPDGLADPGASASA